MENLSPFRFYNPRTWDMTRFVRRSWWKVLAVLLVVYGIVAGMLVPLKPNLLSVSPRSAKLGETVTLDVVGYNTSFQGAGAGAMNAWLIAGDSTDFSLRAESVEVLDNRRARVTFKLPQYLPDPDTEKMSLPIYVNSPGDGAFVDPST